MLQSPELNQVRQQIIDIKAENEPSRGIAILKKGNLASKARCDRITIALSCATWTECTRESLKSRAGVAWDRRVYYGEYTSSISDNISSLHDPNALVYPIKAGSVVRWDEASVLVGAEPDVVRAINLFALHKCKIWVYKKRIWQSAFIVSITSFTFYHNRGGSRQREETMLVNASKST